MPWTSAAPRPYAKPLASRSRTSLLIWQTGPRKTATLCCASSTATCQPKGVRHEALFRESASCGSVGHRFSPGWIISRPGGSSAVSLARAETLLPDPLRSSRTQAFGRLLDDRPPLVHAEGNVEIQLVPARLRIRHRAAG